MRNRLMSSYKVALVLFMSVALVSCANFAKNSFRTLSVSKATYDTVLTAAGDLYREGKLTDEQKQEFIDVGEIYRDAHQTAADAMIAYMTTDSAEDKDKAEVALLKFQEVMSKLLALAVKYGIKYGEGG